MEEIAERFFKEELQELLNRYKDRLTIPQIVHIAQSIFRKTIGFKDNPERLERIFNNAVHNLTDVNGLKVPAELLEGPDPEFKKMLQGEFDDSSERLYSAEEHLKQIMTTGPSFLEQHALNKDFIAHPPVTKKWSSEYNTLQGDPKCTD